MIRKEWFVLLCIFACALEVYNKPVYKAGIRQCFKQECPENTFACEKLSRLSEDKKQIVSDIRCLDLTGNSLRNVTTQEDNPFGPDTEYKGYSYTGAFEVSVDNENEEFPNVENHEGDKNKDTEVEDLTR